MRIFLRILVVLQLLLSIGALVLGFDLYKKREELKVRVLRFEEFTMRLEPVIESEPINDQIDPPYQLPKGQEDSFGFWEEFKADGGVNREAKTAPTMQINRRALKNPFLRDPDVPERIQLDPEMKTPILKGPGTQDSELTNIIAKAQAQYTRLQDTRTWLTRTREEMQTLVDDHNVLYDKLKSAEAEIVRLNENLAKLRVDLSNRDREIAKLNANNEQLEADIRDRDDQIDELNEKVDELDTEKTLLTSQLQDCLEKIQAVGTNPGDEKSGPRVISGIVTVVEQGRKGNVVFVDKANHFAIISIRADSDLAPGVNLTAIGPDSSDSDTPTGRLRVTDVRAGEMKAVVDILKNWELKRGDVVLY